MDNSPLIQVDEHSSSPPPPTTSRQLRKNKNFHSSSPSPLSSTSSTTSFSRQILALGLGSSSSSRVNIGGGGSDFDVNSIKSINNINNYNNNNHNNSTTPPTTTTQSNRRMSLLKALTRRNGQQGKHKKLNDNWVNGNRDPVLHGVTFYVKFLGSVLMDKAGSEQAAEATKTVIHMVKAGKKTSRLGLQVSSSGITLLDGVSGEVSSRISIYDIAHCSADANYPSTFSFIATNKNDTNECYCFATRSRKQSQQITLTIAESFNLAFEIWQNSCCGGDKESEVILNHSSSGVGGGGGGSEKKKQVQQHQQQQQKQQQQKKKTKSHKNNKNQSAWVHFSDEEENEEEGEEGLTSINDHLENINLRTYSISRRQDSLDDHQQLLICLH